MQSSGEQNQWRAMNQPITDRRAPVVGSDEFAGAGQLGGTLEHDASGSQVRKNTRSKRNPGVQKQFKEPDTNDLQNIKKNNYI